MQYVTNIIIALIAGVCSFGGSWVASNKQVALLSYRLEQLEKKFEENDISTRLLKIEMRLDDVESKHEKN